MYLILDSRQLYLELRFLLGFRFAYLGIRDNNGDYFWVFDLWEVLKGGGNNG